MMTRGPFTTEQLAAMPVGTVIDVFWVRSNEQVDYYWIKATPAGWDTRYNDGEYTANDERGFYSDNTFSIWQSTVRGTAYCELRNDSVDILLEVT